MSCFQRQLKMLANEPEMTFLPLYGFLIAPALSKGVARWSEAAGFTGLAFQTGGRGEKPI